MYLMVISDTHGRTTEIMNVLLENKKITHVVHLGDMVRDAEDIEYAFGQRCIIKVSGNNDFFSREKEESTFVWNNITFFACHGHKYGVRYSKGPLATRAKETGAEICLFGHTHIKYDEVIDGVRLLNPSSRGYYLIDKNKNCIYKDL